MLILRDFHCPQCKTTLEDLVLDAYCPPCPACQTPMERILGESTGPGILTTIIPTYPGSQRRKAGYQHKHINRPATKTQIGPGGSVSKREAP